MKPNKKYLKISDNENNIKSFLADLVLKPRIRAIKWARLTKQTPNMKIGYPGQHLASLITGIEGERTGARGDDLKDGTEVKSCSRVDQLDNCKDCKKRLLRIEPLCPHCGSGNIKRMNDSKWLFSIKSESELDVLTKVINRIFLTISDYPNYDNSDFESIRFQAFEIWNKTDRHKNFKTLMTNYYHKIFLKHIEKNPKKTPAPKNFWPYSYQFYLCNPVKVFEAIVSDANNLPSINITKYYPPDFDRTNIVPEQMPTSLLKKYELELLSSPNVRDIIEPQIIVGHNYSDLKSISNMTTVNKQKLKSVLPYINEETTSFLPLRDTDRITTERTPYRRR